MCAQAPRTLLSFCRAIFGELVLCHTFNGGAHHKEDSLMPSSRQGGAGVMDRCVGHMDCLTERDKAKIWGQGYSCAMCRDCLLPVFS